MAARKVIQLYVYEVGNGKKWRETREEGRRKERRRRRRRRRMGEGKYEVSEEGEK